jgi:hypothetical protein
VEVEANDTLPILGHLGHKEGTHTGHKIVPEIYNHPHHVKKEVVYSLISRTKVIYQD